MKIPPGNSDQVINSFSGENEFLSNFYACEIRLNGLLFYSAEQAFHFSKLVSYVDRMKMLTLVEPMKAKRFSRKCEIIPEWDDMRTGVMLEIVRAKFVQNGYLAHSLRETGKKLLIEGNHWNDTYWGSVWNRDVGGWMGDNHLGRILMIVRDHLI